MQQPVESPEQTLLEIYQAALNAVDGRYVTRSALAHRDWPGDVPLALFACGKAAPAMAGGALEYLGDQIQYGLLVTKRGYLPPGWPSHWQCLEAGHPLPDAASLEAGRQLLAFLEGLPDDMPLLTLISGGSSALLELLPSAVTLADLQRINDWLLGSGLPIDEMNRVRKALSCLKGGRMRGYLGRRPVLNLMISDVRHDDPAVIGSGLLSEPSAAQALPEGLPDWLQERLAQVAACPPADRPTAAIEQQVIAANRDACQAAGEAARAYRLPVRLHEPIFVSVDEAADRLADYLADAPPGVDIWGGETTLILPDSPGQGGRNQHLALRLAVALQGRAGIHVLCGASDGSDGPGQDAGALITGHTLEEVDYPGGAETALARADSGRFLDEAGALISTGPTGSNVMDLVISLKTAD